MGSTTTNTHHAKNYQKNTHGGLFRNPTQNALYHTVQMVLVDPGDKVIICFLWVLKFQKQGQKALHVFM